TDSTTASRTSPLSQRKTPRPPGVGSRSTSVANHSSSWASSVSADHTSSGPASSSISRTISTSNLQVAYYLATEQLHVSAKEGHHVSHPDGDRSGRPCRARVRHLLPAPAGSHRLPRPRGRRRHREPHRRPAP